MIFVAYIVGVVTFVSGGCYMILHDHGFVGGCLILAAMFMSASSKNDGKDGKVQ